MLALAGCGDNVTPDPPPVPFEGGPVTFLHQDLPATKHIFPTTYFGGHASALFVVRNDTDVGLASVRVALDASLGYAIDGTMSTCVAAPELVPHDLCTVLVRWNAPSSCNHGNVCNSDAECCSGVCGPLEGSFRFCNRNVTQQLVVTSGGVVSSLSLEGSVGVQSDFQIVDPTAIDFGIVPLGSVASADMRLTNTNGGAQSISQSSSGTFSHQVLDCPSGLPIHGGCNVRLAFSPTTSGWASTRFSLAGMSATTLTAYGARGIDLVKNGTGTGRVSSVPSGIDCGTDCESQLAYVIGDATLYAVADEGSAFVGWEQAECGAAPTCVMPEQSDGDIMARFVRR